jgi:hypothetical protein
MNSEHPFGDVQVPSYKWKPLCSVAPIHGKLVGMVVFNDQVIVATELGVFRLVGDTFVPIKFEPIPVPTIDGAHFP